MVMPQPYHFLLLDHGRPCLGFGWGSNCLLHEDVLSVTIMVARCSDGYSVIVMIDMHA